MTQSEGELAEAWLLEAKRRAGELDRGEVQPIDAEEAMTQGPDPASMTHRFRSAAGTEHLPGVEGYAETAVRSVDRGGVPDGEVVPAADVPPAGEPDRVGP